LSTYYRVVLPAPKEDVPHIIYIYTHAVVDIICEHVSHSLKRGCPRTAQVGYSYHQQRQGYIIICDTVLRDGSHVNNSSRPLRGRLYIAQVHGRQVTAPKFTEASIILCYYNPFVHVSCMRTTSISPFGHKTVGDLSGVSETYSLFDHTRPSLRLSGIPLRQGQVVPVDHFFKV
jgi:hypothetical protein